jgi:hypothetical protein
MLNGDRYSDVDGTFLNIGQDKRVIRTYATGQLAVCAGFDHFPLRGTPDRIVTWLFHMQVRRKEYHGLS